MVYMSNEISAPESVEQIPQENLSVEGTEEVKASEESIVSKKEEQPEQKQEKRDPFSSKFAALSRKEKALKQQEQTLKQAQEEAERKVSELTAKYSKFDSFEDRLKKEPLAVLGEYGLNVEQLVEIALNGGKPTVDMATSELERKFQSKLQEIEQKLLEKELKEAESLKAKEEQEQEKLIEGFVSEIEGFITSNPDKYEFINEYQESINDVYELILEYYNRDQRIISIEEAADLVEQALEQEAERATKLKKISSKFKVQESQTKPSTENKPTLNNNLSAPQNAEKVQSQYNEHEQLQKAAALLKWI